MGDWYLNINSRGYVGVERELGINHDAHDFDTISHCAIRKTIRMIKPSSSDVVVVLGCGKGRTVCHFARERVGKVIGVEISKMLCEIARKNAVALRFAKCPIEIRNEDAASTDLREGTIFFMFNPFGEKTLSRVVDAISESKRKGSIRVIYMNAQFPEVFERNPTFEIVFDYQRKRGQRVIIYQSREK